MIRGVQQWVVKVVFMAVAAIAVMEVAVVENEFFIITALIKII